MSVPNEVRRDAERTGALVHKKLLEIIDLQADIDTLWRGDQPTPFGSEKWQYACLEAPAKSRGNNRDPVCPLRAGGESQGQ
jgi:hypothetical protein